MFRLTVVTPERAFLDAECMNVTLPGKLGEMQVLAGHAPCLVELKSGRVVYENKTDGVVSFMIGHGFVEVEAHQVNILCELARHKDEIDQTHELSVQKDLTKKLMNTAGLDENEEKQLQAELEKSVASLKLFE